MLFCLKNGDPSSKPKVNILMFYSERSTVREKSEKNLKCSEKNFEIKYNIYQIKFYYLMCLLYHESASNLKKRI